MIYHVSISYVMLLRVNLSVAVVAMTTNKTHHLANGTTVEVRIKRAKPKLKEKLQTNKQILLSFQWKGQDTQRLLLLPFK